MAAATIPSLHIDMPAHQERVGSIRTTPLQPTPNTSANTADARAGVGASASAGADAGGGASAGTGAGTGAASLASERARKTMGAHIRLVIVQWFIFWFKGQSPRCRAIQAQFCWRTCLCLEPF